MNSVAQVGWCTGLPSCWAVSVYGFRDRDAKGGASVQDRDALRALSRETEPTVVAFQVWAGARGGMTAAVAWSAMVMWELCVPNIAASQLQHRMNDMNPPWDLFN